MLGFVPQPNLQADIPSTHGDSYEEALQNGKEVLELLIEDYQARNKPLPQPLTNAVKLEYELI